MTISIGHYYQPHSFLMLTAWQPRSADADPGFFSVSSEHDMGVISVASDGSGGFLSVSNAAEESGGS